MSNQPQLAIIPSTIRTASRFVGEMHRHHKPCVRWQLFALGCEADGKLCGVAIVGRPRARMLCDGWTAEVTRLATDGTPNACSMLYGAAWRAARALGYRRLVTYILESEPGTSLRAAGWRRVGECGGGTWGRRARPRSDTHPLELKVRWEVEVPAAAITPAAITTPHACTHEAASVGR